MGPRAAARLDTLGFTRVYEYKAGKQDWLAAGLPSEGTLAGEPTIAPAVRPDVPRFGLEDRVGPILDTLRAGGWELAAIVNQAGILLGRVRAQDITNPDATASCSTGCTSDASRCVQPDVGAVGASSVMVERPSVAFVTDPEGRLRGLVTRRDIARALRAHRKAS